MHKSWAVMAVTLAVTVAPVTASAAAARAVPATTTTSASLADVTVRSATNAWAVGSYQSTTYPDGQALIEHWNGTSWKVVTSPIMPGSGLTSVSADSATDAWAVGSYYSGGEPTPLIERWEGSGWSAETAPPTGTGTILTGVSADSSSDAWAVGYNTFTGEDQPVYLHWNGSYWDDPVGLVMPAGNTLTAVTAISPTDAWAVGSYAVGPTTNEVLLAHWDGTTWTQDTTSTTLGSLSSVSATSATNIWAAGTDSSGKSLILHYTGTKWIRMTSPNPGYGSDMPLHLNARVPGRVWAVGTYNSTPTTYSDKSLVLHYTGTTWQQVTAPNPGQHYNILMGVSEDSASDAWAVGYLRNVAGGPYQTVTLHWNGTTWVRVTSPN